MRSPCAHLFERRFADSLAEFELALRLNPNFSPAGGYCALALCYSGRWVEADRAAHRALHLSPRDPFSQVYAGIRGFAQFLGGNCAEAMRLASEATRERSEFSGGYRVLTAAAGMAGQADGAADALAQLRRAQPNISLEWIATQMPFEHDVDRQHYIEGHRRAGLTWAGSVPALTGSNEFHRLCVVIPGHGRAIPATRMPGFLASQAMTRRGSSMERSIRRPRCATHAQRAQR